MINYRTLENLDKHNILIIKIFFDSKIICYILTGLTEASPQFDYVPQPGYYGKRSNSNFVAIIRHVTAIVKIATINCHGGGKY